MKLITWNVNSLKARADFVALYLDEAAPDILCIQELKLEDEHVPRDLFEERGYHLAIHGQKQWNGVLIASKLPIAEVERGLPEADEGEARLIAARIAGIDIVNLYCPQGQSEDSPKFAYKLRFFRALREWLARRPAEVPRIVCGDLNVAPRPEDVYDVKRFTNVPSYHPLEHAEWRELEALGLVDAVWPHLAPKGHFTFWDYRGGAFRFNKGMRIDHVLVNEHVAPWVEKAWVDRDARKKKQKLTASDHAPLCVELKIPGA